MLPLRRRASQEGPERGDVAIAGTSLVLEIGVAELADVATVVVPRLEEFAHDLLDGDELTERALDAGVLVVPGRFFGMREGVRVSLGRAPDDCRAALEAFGRVLDEL